MADQKSLETLKMPKRSLFSPFFQNFPSLFTEGFNTGDLENLTSSNVSLSEDNSHVFVEANLPGLSKDDIEISLHEGILWIKGDCKKVEEDKERKYYCKASRSFSYRVALPTNINETEEPKAQYKDGVILITFNKLQKEQPKKITISK